MQDITMPAGDALGSVPEEDAKALEPYAGSTLDTGAEAKAFADHYILAHMNASSDGRTYEEVSGEYIALSDEAKASEEGQALAGLRQTLFTGDTLRGLLLYGYAFATIGTILGIAAIVSFVTAAALTVLVVLGFRHAGRVRDPASSPPHPRPHHRPHHRLPHGPPSRPDHAACAAEAVDPRPMPYRGQC
ncbi:hypothetical protein [Nocardioides bigeumensis]|uniref:Uncharacterized protein n=1 Tax=Nocardioides bigeumensis TaxID=433657 RepID=A0ABN2Y489_9ACTN